MIRRNVWLFVVVVSFVFVAVFCSHSPVHAADVPEGLVLYFTFDTEDKTTITDLSGHGNNATIHGQPEWETGKLGDAMNFAANGQFLEVADSETLRSDEITIALWMNWTGDILPNESFSKFSYQVGGYLFKMENTEMNFWFYDKGATAHMQRARPQPVPGEWMHLAVTFDGSVQKGYVNGISGAADMAWAGPIGHVDANLRMGANSSMTFTGMMDDVAIYNRALTQEEILKAMENGHMVEIAVRPMDKLAGTWGQLKQ